MTTVATPLTTPTAPTIGFIGIGHMCSSIVEGLIASGTDPRTIIVSNRTLAKAEDFATRTGVQVAENNTDLIHAVGSGIVILGVKPQQMEALMEEIRESATQASSIIVSLAAGISLITLAQWAHSSQPIARALPNVAASVRQSMTGLAYNSNVTEQARNHISQLFTAIGRTQDIEDSQFSTFSAIAGCSPAFTFEFIDSLSRAAVKNGLAKKDANFIATQAVFGSALLALNSELSVADLSNTVQSPGGTTIAGVVEMEESGFRAAVLRGVQASINRDKELG
ncbi:pyrroline-5-carboxylate reductase [Actinotignum urinale]|uniref:pyrroline-5-carboxylate reductase n=1 Tax=Actinotignum urinale TaxID=190146 RepID=UPI002A840474|nr:pyrroline-5-carboxylate reductase [Actinotignum urinale]MDY5129210.1 pyrroline-5-carboxylate reductase [Actinotignum urinale]